MSAQLFATNGPFKFQAWCDECKDGYNGSRVPAEDWQRLHNRIKHSASVTTGAFSYPKEA